MVTREEVLGFTPQKEIIYNKLLPYYESIDCESNCQIADIKSNLARAVQLKELRPGVVHWTSKLYTYINLYGRKFSKTDHLAFIKLYYDLLVIPELEFKLVERFSKMLNVLLKKRSILSREDLVLPWRPLYALVKRVLYSSYEQLGMEWIPGSIEGCLKNVVQSARVYFSDESTQEMLDEWRPLMCPFDYTMEVAITYFVLFLPTTLPPDKHQLGFKLWLDEFLQIWDSYHNSPQWEGVSIMTDRFSRVADDNIGYIDWGPYIPKFLTCYLRGFNLPVGSKRLQVARRTKGYENVVMATFLVAMMGKNQDALNHLKTFFKAVESFFHPSNAGRFSFKLQRVLHKIPQAFIKRLHRERYAKPSWQNNIPDDYKLTEDDITLFVEAFKPVIFLAIFSKMGHLDAAAGLQSLALVRPELVIPQLLEKTYAALETLTEPHQLTATLSCVVSVARSMLKARKRYPEGASHVIPILTAVLPGIDPNDFIKCMITLQAISTFSALVPLVDCSEAPMHWKDLTEQERELCSATATFEAFITLFMERCFTLIENSTFEHTTSQDSTQAKVNRQESLAEVGVASTFSTMLNQCSPEIYQVALNKLFNYASSRVLETKVAGKMLASMCRSAAKVNPKKALAKFIPHCSSIVLSLTSSEEAQNEVELDNELLFNLQVLSEIVRCDSSVLLTYKSTILEVLRSTLHLRCKQGYELACNVLKYFLKAMTILYPLEYCSNAEGLGKPISEYLPIRHWAMTGDVHNLNIHWHIPTPEGIAAAKEVFAVFCRPEIEKLKGFVKGQNLSREELLQSLTIVLNTVIGMAFILPRWNKEPVTDIIDFRVEFTELNLSTGIPETGSEFENTREELALLMNDLQVYMLEKHADDTKSLLSIITIYSHLVSYFGCSKEEYNSRSHSFALVKRSMEDKLRRKKNHLRPLLIDRVYLQHDFRRINSSKGSYTAIDRVVVHNLVSLSISQYSEVRTKAQEILLHCYDYYSVSKRDTVNKVLAGLKEDKDIPHHQFKGSLYIMVGHGRPPFACFHRWKVLHDCWLAIIQAGHSEKPSIMAVIDKLMVKIQKHFSTVAIENQITDECLKDAEHLLDSTSAPAPIKGGLTAEEHEQATQWLQERNQENTMIYNNLVESLVNLIENGNLRWKFSQLALGFLGLLIRTDIPFPARGVRLMVNSLVHEALTVRKIAVATVGAILKQQKRPHKMITIDPAAQSSSTAAASESEGGLNPGTRSDNTWHHYNCTRAPTKEEWEKWVFVEKTHWGYYQWPKPFKVYAPVSEQPKLGRSIEELTPGEKAIYVAFSDPDFIEQLMGFLSLEDRKGKDKFQNKRFTLFKGLFRNFDDAFLPVLKPHLLRLSQDAQESSQRCLSEIVSGLIRGYKHWSFEKVEKLWEFLVPILRTVLNQMTVDTIRDWNMCFSTASESRDPRKLYWLLETLMESPITGDGGSFSDASRLFVLQGCLVQQEWRVPGLLHRLLVYLEQHLTHTYKNVRDRVGSVLSWIFLFDFAMPNGNATTSPHTADFAKKLLPRLAALQTIEVESSASASNTEMMEVQSREEDGRQDIIKLSKTVMKWLIGSLGKMYSPISPEMLKFLPMLAPLENVESDEELNELACLTLACMAQSLLPSHNIPYAIQALQEVANGTSWRGKCSMLQYMQVMIFYNLFAISQPEYVEQIKNLIVGLLKDERLEVREAAATTLSGLFHCGFFRIDSQLQKDFEKMCKTKLPAKRLRLQDPQFNAEAFYSSIIQRHAGVLGLSACIQSCPYDVPVWMPQILMDLTDHLHDPQPIELTVRKTFSDFRRTHHDNWQEHKQQFTDDQLVILTDLLVSPCYYA
ncbi:proteasome activator complex subunit 4-like [Anneissia japonica]|uniref:proteasome activator complex subunit 4-like n=1 Tax=Anneissia japonica TaxID=1529436 RepID=UPI0014256593|nr:proteasome activator complex subunit 4-like [Anneissia japonica]